MLGLVFGVALGVTFDKYFR